MNIEECKNIIKKEMLIYYNLYDEHELKPDEVCIRKVNDKFVVFTMSERCSSIEDSIKEFSNESDALEVFVNRLRATKRLFSK